MTTLCLTGQLTTPTPPPSTAFFISLAMPSALANSLSMTVLCCDALRICFVMRVSMKPGWTVTTSTPEEEPVADAVWARMRREVAKVLINDFVEAYEIMLAGP